jgi:hypothetical protein
MENMTIFILGIAILSAGTYLMRLGGQNSAADWHSERSQALLSDAATVLLFSVALATTFYEGNISPGWRVLGVAFAVFCLAKSRHCGDRRGGSGDGAAARGGHKLKAPRGRSFDGVTGLFIQFSSHVYAVTRECLGNFVR